MSTATQYLANTSDTVLTPLQAHRSQQMAFLVPDYNDPYRDGLRRYIEPFLDRHASLGDDRQKARETILSHVKINPIDRPSGPIFFAFDVDGTKLDCYTTSSDSGYEYIKQIGEHVARKKHASASRVTEDLFAATRGIAPEYLCHSVDVFMQKLSSAAGMPEINPIDNPRFDEGLKPIRQNWMDARRLMNLQLVSSDLKPVLQEIKKQGDVAYIVSNGPEASVVERMYRTLGAAGRELMGGMAVYDLKDLPRINDHASSREWEFRDSFERRGDIIRMAQHELKPSPEHLIRALTHENDKRHKAGKKEIGLDNIVMVGDSLGSDGDVVKNLNAQTGSKAQLVLTTQFVIADKEVLRRHNEVGARKPDGTFFDNLGVAPIIKKLQGPYQHPQRAISRLGQVTQTYYGQQHANMA